MFPDGTSLDVTNSANVSYASSNGVVATISPSGVVTAISAGQTSVSATYVPVNLPVTVPVTVANPSLTASPANLTFPSQIVGTKSSPQVVQLTNARSSPPTILSITQSGDYFESDNCVSGLPLAPGGVERTSSRAGLSPAENQRLFTAHFHASNPCGQSGIAV